MSSPATGMSNGVRDELTRWLEHGRSIRAKLVAERDDLLRRLKEIDAALGAIPAEQVAGASGDAPSKEMSARAVVLAVLGRTGKGPLTTGEITREAQVFRPINAKLVAHAVHRMVRAGEVVAEGTHGKGSRMRYYLAQCRS